ncbi:MAG TPA: NADH-quinone oxidoreductase subunit L [Patescibacteria group bacterium]|nr:NADH-quinone oxidoreductase subunit L [Patescibacteria group bacterium]
MFEPLIQSAAPLLAAVEAEPIATSGAINLVPLLLLLPIAGFAFSAFFGRRIGRFAFLVPLLLIVATWAIAMVVAYEALSGGFGEHGAGITLWTWIPAGAFNVEMGLFVDQLTACLLIVVTTIGMLVHLYSVGYMAHDPGRWRFFAYLNLFMFSMLLLVLGDSWLTVFAAWELVGLSSYLLIGFWYPRRPAALAAKKAFIVNRVGDVGFALGIMLIWVSTGTLDIRASFGLIAQLDPTTIAAIALLLFCGAVGKSAQFPLHVWLPDAMEGPTPVSALIHAATMVNAGIYLVARANPIFALAPGVMVIVAAIGIFTAILAASIALTQTDIKRVLAYSTLSQLGYMFAALGVGAFTAAIFHLMAHGFFKGLLFLGSGSVIHAVRDEQDMNKMGGLWRKIPVTHWTMLIGTLAIAGLPPLAGFFSKDEILGESFAYGFYWVWAIGLVVAVMTAFYMWRLMGKTFYGEPSAYAKGIWDRIHESTWTMTLPLVLLAIPSAGIGMALGLPFGDSTLKHWLKPVFAESKEMLHPEPHVFELAGIDGVLILVSVAAAALGLVVAIWLFGAFRRPGNHARVESLAGATGATRFLHRATLNKWWFDDLNHLLFIVIGGRVAGAAWWFDRTVVDGTVHGVGRMTIGAGRGLRRVQTGRVQNYALGIAIGLIVMAGAYLVITAT